MLHVDMYARMYGWTTTTRTATASTARRNAADVRVFDGRQDIVASNVSDHDNMYATVR